MPHLVGAVARAGAGSDAAVIDHEVQALVVMQRRLDRAAHFAGRLLAMHAGNGLEMRVGVVEPGAGLQARVIAVDAQPMHLAADRHLLLADHRNVVLGLARHDAGVAADAAVLVDHHAPGAAVVALAGVERRQVVGRLRHGRPADAMDLHEIVPLHGRMVLGGGEPDGAPELRQGRAGALPRVPLEAERVGRIAEAAAQRDRACCDRSRGSASRSRPPARAGSRPAPRWRPCRRRPTPCRHWPIPRARPAPGSPPRHCPRPPWSRASAIPAASRYWPPRRPRPSDPAGTARRAPSSQRRALRRGIAAARGRRSRAERPSQRRSRRAKFSARRPRRLRRPGSGANCPAGSSSRHAVRRHRASTGSRTTSGRRRGAGSSADGS